MKYLYLGLALSALTRLFLADSVLMLGDDQLGYMLAVDAIRSGDFTGGMGVKHLAQGYYLLPWVALFGDSLGGKLAAVVASVSPAVPLYYLLRRTVPHDFINIPIALLFVWWVNYGPVLGYGFAYLMSLTIALIILNLIIKYSQADYREAWPFLYIGIATGLMAILAVSNISALLPLLAILLMYAVMLTKKDTTYQAAGVLLLLVMVPVMVSMLSISMPYGGVYFRSLWNTLTLLIIGAAMIYTALKMPDSTSQLVIAIVLGLVILGILTSDSRPIMTTLGRVWLWLPIPGAIIGSWAAYLAYIRWQPPKNAFIGVALILMAFFVPAWVTAFNVTLQVHSTYTTETRELIKLIDSGSVVTSPESLGWHVKAITGLTVHTTNPLDSRTVASCILGYIVCDAKHTLKEQGIEHILVKDGDKAQYWSLK